MSTRESGAWTPPALREAAWALLCVVAGGTVATLSVGAPIPSSLLNAAGWIAALALFAFAVRRPEAGVWVALATFALNDYGRLASVPIPITVFEAALAGTLVAWGWGLASGTIARPRLGLLHVALALPFVAALWSLPLSLDPARTAIGAARLFGLWLFAMVIARYAEDPARRSRMLDVFVGVGAALTLLSFAQYAFPGLPIGNTHMQFDASGTLALTRPAGFYLDTNFLGGYLSVASLVALVRIVQARRLREAALWALPALLCAAGMALTLSRSALVGFLVAAVVVLVTAPPRRRTWLVSAAIVLAIVALPVVPKTYTQRITSMTNVMSEGSLATRYLMIGSTLEIIRDYWGTGTGLAAFDVAYPEYRRVGSLPRILRPHEVPLAMPAEMGVAGLIAELGLLAGLFAAFANARRRGWRAEDSAVLAGLVALLTQSFFQYYLYFECLWLFAALAASLQVPSEEVASA